MREYKLTITANDKKIVSETFDSLEVLSVVICSILRDMSLLYLADAGEFIKSMYLKNQYYKLYRIKSDVPDMIIDIKKTSSGDINKDRLLELIRRTKKSFERIDN